MEVFFKTSFIKDFEDLPKPIKPDVRSICSNIFPKLKYLESFTEYPCIKLRGYKEYYRIRVGHYRIGFKQDGKQIIFMRVLHRKDVYKYFP